MRELHLFAGAGGGILGGILLGHTCVCAVEIEPYPRKVLLQRQRDGILPRFPIWDDVCTFDGKPWRGRVDAICGGFPCQDISSAGKGAGITGERSGLWKEFARIIGEIRPRFVFVENSPILTSRGLSVVLGDLASMGYDAEWGVLGGSHIAASSRRERIWILACRHEIGRKGCKRIQGVKLLEKYTNRTPSSFDATFDGGKYPPKNGNFSYRKDDDLANGVDRLAAIGNGQVPALAALAWQTLTGK